MWLIVKDWLGGTAASVPTFRSSTTSLSGGGPTLTGTAGAPAGRGSAIATHGFPAALGRASAAGSVDDGAVEFTLVLELPVANTATTSPRIRAEATRPAIPRCRVRRRLRAAAARAWRAAFWRAACLFGWLLGTGANGIEFAPERLISLNCRVASVAGRRRAVPTWWPGGWGRRPCRGRPRCSPSR